MKKYDKTAIAARFLLGGIGTGNVSVTQNGRLTDFEFFNNPNKGFGSPYTFFAAHCVGEDGSKNTTALESELQPPFDGSHGFNAWEIGGLPQFKNSYMSSQYPFVNIDLNDEKLPISATMEAFTPFIPLNTDDSSLPGAVIRYTIKNISNQAQTVSVAGSFTNLCNYRKLDIWKKPIFDGEGKNKYIEKEHCKGIHFTTTKKPDELSYMDMAFTTNENNVTYREYWSEGAWWDGLQDFWNDFTDDGELTNDNTLKGKGNRLHKSDFDISSLCVKKTIQPEDQKTFTFFLTWHHPNRIRSWDQHQDVTVTSKPLIKNYYAKFGDSITVANYMAKNLEFLEEQSRTFSNSFYNSSYPDYVLDAVGSTLTVIRSNTCFRVEDGTFFAFEGQFDNAGCCDGSCTHVWNYAQSLAFLFPELEQSMRRTEFLYETDENGSMMFRARKYLQDPEFDMPPAADGQMGCIIRLYREWKISGDDNFLREMWPNAKKALEYAFTNWDIDGDGVMESEQHNTYDIEFYGPNSMMNAIYYTALRAGEEISRYLGNNDDAERYADIQKRGAKLLDELTFNGEYYEQKIDDVNEYKYQYGKGCLADQLLGQQLAHVNGLGYILDEQNVKSSIKSVFKYNFLENFENHVNLQRTYARNDESGLILCSWPKGGRPEIPFVYSDEVWTGIEYHVASHLIYEGFVEEGLTIVKAVRDRHDGIRRSPWNEVECGHHYARSLASYGVILALSGHVCDAVNKTLSFSPANKDNSFKTFFSCGDGWGTFERTIKEDGKLSYDTKVLYGNLDGYKIICDNKTISI